MLAERPVKRHRDVRGQRVQRLYAGLSFVGTSHCKDLRPTQLRHSQLIYLLLPGLALPDADVLAGESRCPDSSGSTSNTSRPRCSSSTGEPTLRNTGRCGRVSAGLFVCRRSSSLLLVTTMSVPVTFVGLEIPRLATVIGLDGVLRTSPAASAANHMTA